MVKIMQYGLQRTGTNYVQGILLENFTELSFLNNVTTRSLPLHKHFRLYSEKHFIPSPDYLNNFHYESFEAFDAHVQQFVNEKDFHYQIITKHPISWYISICRTARRNKWHSYIGKQINSHYMLDYNLFYSKWLSFSRQSKRVHLYKYEDFLYDFDSAIEKVRIDFDLRKKDSGYQNLTKVKMSKSFTKDREAYYTQSKFYDSFTKDELLMLTAHLDTTVIEEIGYTLRNP
ncbi:hypothetical protein ACFLT1_01565 [Bacteroidota bacterium]